MRRSRGQGSAEAMLVISVVTIAAVASASTMVPLFRSGVENLGRDVSAILSSGSVGGVGGGGYTYNGGPSNGSVYNGGGEGEGGGATGQRGTVNGAANGRAAASGRDMADAMRDMSPAADTHGTDPPDIGSPFLG